MSLQELIEIEGKLKADKNFKEVANKFYRFFIFSFMLIGGIHTYKNIEFIL